MSDHELKVKVHGHADDHGLAIQKAYHDDAGFDLFCQGDHWIESSRFRDIPLGVSIELPFGYWALLTGRSSTLRNRGLMVAQGVIDAGYRGPLFAGVFNLTHEAVHVANRDRIAQLILIPSYIGRAKIVSELSNHPRGSNGFGSSGA